MIYVIDLDNSFFEEEDAEDGVQPFYAYGPFSNRDEATDWGNRHCSFFSVVRPWWEE